MNRSIYIAFIILLFTNCTKPTKACFTYSPSDINGGNIVTFNSACSKNASRFVWEFSDTTGTISTSSKIITHVFKDAGSYKVKLEAWRKDGVTLGKDEFTITKTITVK